MLRRRVSIRVEHTEVTLTITETAARGSGLVEGAAAGSALPKLCPDCGAPWIRNFQDAVSTLKVTAAQWKVAASEGRLHLFCSPNNEIWICEHSIQQMKENS